MEQPRPRWRAALIGDVIGSRQTGQRERLQESLRDAVAEVNVMVEPVQPLGITIGDELQGAYSSVGAALAASLWLQVHLVGVADIRQGIGWGELYFGDDRSPLDQDGPCWWRARDAVDQVAREARSHRVPQSRRTMCITGTPQDDVLAGYLRLRDQLMTGIDRLDAEIMLGLARGRRQTDLADDLGLNKSSVSRRVQGHGLQALLTSLPDVVLEEA